MGPGRNCGNKKVLGHRGQGFLPAGRDVLKYFKTVKVTNINVAHL